MKNIELKNKHPMSFRTADLVVSKKGRDQKRVFMIVETVSEDYVLIADGSLRKLEKPKLKKTKHLETFGVASERVTGKLTEGKKITNAELRKMLKEITSKDSD